VGVRIDRINGLRKRRKQNCCAASWNGSIRFPCRYSSPDLYQYTAIDDCMRYRVLQIYKKRTAGNTLDFLERVVEQLRFRCSASRPTEGWSFLRRRFNAD